MHIEREIKERMESVLYVKGRDMQGRREGNEYAERRKIEELSQTLQQRKKNLYNS